MLRNIFTRDPVDGMVDKMQEELHAVINLFEELKVLSDSVKEEQRKGQLQELYFLKEEEIKVDRLEYLANRNELFNALDVANSYGLVDIEVGFFKEVLAASVVRGRRA
jgi:hypothetical protein